MRRAKNNTTTKRDCNAAPFTVISDNPPRNTAGIFLTTGYCISADLNYSVSLDCNGHTVLDVVKEFVTEGLSKGVHKLDVKLYTHRFNSFGAVHNADAALDWHGPDAWRTKEEKWTYEYRLKEVGVLSAPVIKA